MAAFVANWPIANKDTYEPFTTPDTTFEKYVKSVATDGFFLDQVVDLEAYRMMTKKFVGYTCLLKTYFCVLFNKGIISKKSYLYHNEHVHELLSDLPS